MQSYFTSDFFRHNRERLQKQVDVDGPIVVVGNGLLQRDGDGTYPFHQSSNFWYLTGIEEPDVALVIDKNQTYLMLPERDTTRVAFDGAVASDDLSARSGVKTVLSLEDGWHKLVGGIKQGRVATVLPAPTYDKRRGTYVNPAPKQFLAKLKRAVPGLKYVDIADALTSLRVFKQAPELAALQAAINITASTIQTVCEPETLKRFAHEYQLEAALTLGFRSQGARGHAFEPIVANGVRATVLHNVANNAQLDQNQLTVVDVGAEVEHYAADITRTLAIKKPSARQKAIHQIVLEAQQLAFDHLKPGMLLRDHEGLVAQFIGEKLQALRLIKKVDSPSVRKYFPHATSHFLGLDVHDVGHYDQPLQPGMVITVEPGIYIPEESIGVRIEDDVLITENGIRILSDNLSRSLT